MNIVGFAGFKEATVLYAPAEESYYPYNESIHSYRQTTLPPHKTRRRPPSWLRPLRLGRQTRRCFGHDREERESYLEEAGGTPSIPMKVCLLQNKRWHRLHIYMLRRFLFFYIMVGIKPTIWDDIVCVRHAHGSSRKGVHDVHREVPIQLQLSRVRYNICPISRERERGQTEHKQPHTFPSWIPRTLYVSWILCRSPIHAMLCLLAL